MIEQRSDEWFAQRLGRVTASKVKDVMAKGRSGAFCYPPELHDAAPVRAPDRQARGRIHQRRNAAWYRPGADCSLGLRVQCRRNDDRNRPDHPSANRWIWCVARWPRGEHGLVEIKCPSTATHIYTMQSGKHDPQYEWQMLAQMSCSGREWVDFVSFDDRLPDELQYVCFRYHRDEARIREMESEVKAFLEELAELEADMRGRMAA